MQQICSPRPSREQRVSSRHRISQLESEVSRLREAVHDIRAQLGYRPAEATGGTVTHPGSSPSTHDSDDDSTVSDVLAAEQPSHLRALFHNDWLSVDTREQGEQLMNNRSKASAHLLGIARQALQKLIPTVEEVAQSARSGSKWLLLVQTLLPLPFALRSEEELLERYHLMHRADVDAVDLACWLIDVAVILQIGQDQSSSSPAITLQSSQPRSSFSRTVSDTVEAKIMSHHRLAGTIPGLGMAIRLLRL